MKNLFKILFTLLIFFCLNSCSSNDNSDTVIPSGLIVSANGKTKTYKVVVEEDVNEKGTANEYTNLMIRGTLENSDERIFIGLRKGRTGNNAIYQLLYINDKNEDHIYFGSTNNNFSTNTIINSDERKLEGNFSGILYTNGKGTSVQLKGSFNIIY